MPKLTPLQIIVPVVDRSVTIAGISTRELVFKDYATEADEAKLRSAGMLMAQKLAGSLALVTCKEPLKSNLTAHIRANLIENGIAEVRLLRSLLKASINSCDTGHVRPSHRTSRAG